MTVKVTFFHEFRKRQLLKYWNGAGIKAKTCCKSSAKLFREHHIADSHGWCETFCKCPHVDDFAVFVHTLESRNRSACIAEFAVVVILDDVPVLTGIRPPQKLLPAADRHHDPQRKVMRGRDVQHVDFKACNCLCACSFFVHIVLTTKSYQSSKHLQTCSQL